MATEATEELFGGSTDNSVQSSWLNKKQVNDDGLLRPKLEQGKDGKRELTIRLLPNLQRNGKLGATALEKTIIYANFPNNQELQGYFDSLKNIGKECPLTKAFWALKNSKNPADHDKAKLINGSKKYYSYCVVVEDDQVPENVGKIFIFPFGFKILEKIKAEAEDKKKPCKVEDLVYGRNLQLVIKEVGGFYNYDACKFGDMEPATIDGKQLKVGNDGKIGPEEKQRVVDFLYSRTHELEEFQSKDWTAEQHDKANRIIAYLTGSSYDNSSNVFENKKETKAPVTSSSVFGTDDDDAEETPKVTKKTVKSEPETEAKSSKSEKEQLTGAKKKASAFFNDDED